MTHTSISSFIENFAPEACTTKHGRQWMSALEKTETGIIKISTPSAFSTSIWTNISVLAMLVTAIKASTSDGVIYVCKYTPHSTSDATSPKNFIVNGVIPFCNRLNPLVGMSLFGSAMTHIELNSFQSEFEHFSNQPATKTANGLLNRLDSFNPTTSALVENVGTTTFIPVNENSVVIVICEPMQKIGMMRHIISEGRKASPDFKWIGVDLNAN